MNSSELEKGGEWFGGLERERGRDRGRKALSYAIQLHSLGLLVHSLCVFVCAVHVRVVVCVCVSVF